MINEMIAEFTERFAQTPSQLQYTEAGIAVALVIGTILLGWAMSRMFAPKLGRIWESRAGYESEIARRRIRDMVRRLTEVIVVSLILALWSWTLVANVIFAITLAIAAGLLTNDFIRGVRMPDWLGNVMGLGVFVAISFGLVGSIEKLTVALDQVGFDLGDGRISLLNIVTFIFTVVLLFAVARIIGRIVSHSISSSSQFDDTQKLLGQKIATIVIVVIAFFVGIDVLGIDLTALAFFSGAFGLAIGFGMQKTIGNLIAGIILLMDRSIKPGDVIVVGESYGWVNKIGVRAVSVLTRDGKEHLIPNENLMINEVENWSHSDPNVRIIIPVGVSYSSDMRKVQELLYQAVKESKRVLRRPAPAVWLLEFGDNSVNFEIRCWINDPQGGVGSVKGDVMMRVWDLFKEHEIEIPFPQRDVHLKSMPEGFGGSAKVDGVDADKGDEGDKTSGGDKV